MPGWASRMGSMAGVVVWAGVILGGEASTDDRQLVEKIVAGWRARQHTIQTLRARATVDSFFSKGYASARDILSPETGAEKDPVPQEDVWYRGQPQSWDIDFAHGRFRKEFCKARVHLNEVIPSIPVTIDTKPELILVSDGKHTFVTEPEEYGPILVKDPFRQHILFGRGPAWVFVIATVDLPLLWCAGAAISGQYPDLPDILHSDSPDQFVVYRRTRWQDRDCVILRVRNQRSRNSVREFWVDEHPPYLIYRSQVVRFVGESERMEERIDVEYHEHQGHQLPAKWTWTDFYWREGRVFIGSETISIHDIEINTRLEPELFAVRLEPGMGVIDGDKGARYVVDVNGKLVPYRNPEQQRRAADSAKRQQTIKVAISLLVLMVLSAATFLGYRRFTHRCRKK